MPIDPSIAGGYKGIQIADPMAQYAQMTAIQNAQQSNQLNQMKMDEMRQTNQERNALRGGIRPDFDPTNPLHQAELYKLAPSLAPGYIESTLKTRETAGKIKERDFKVQQDKFTHGYQSLGNATTPEAAKAAIDEGVKKGYFDQATADRESATIPTDPVEFKNWRLSKVSNLLSAKDQLEEMRRASLAGLSAQFTTPARGAVGDLAGATLPAGMGTNVSLPATPGAFDYAGFAKAAFAQNPNADTLKMLQAASPNVSYENVQNRLIPVQKNPLAPGYTPPQALAMGMSPSQAGQLGVAQGNLAVNQTNAATRQGQLGVSQGQLGVARAGLGIRAIQADPYNISGVQAAFPIAGAPISGAPSTTEKQPSGAPVVQNVAAALKAGLTGEDLLTHLPTNLANQVRAIGEGREPSPAARSLNTPAARQLMEMVNQAYPAFDAKQYGSMSAAEKAFTSGKKGDITRALNVAVDHLGTLQQVSDALENNDMRLFNQAGNFIALQTGNPAPTDFNAVKRIVADELTKAVLGGAGALGDRKAIDDTINAANSPAQLKSAINRYKQLMGGQLTGLETQYTASTNKKDYRDRFLTPATKAALGTAAPAAADTDARAAALKLYGLTQ